MSLHTRTTEDYSPLRAPIRDARGRDMRPQKERQQYEQAVNARREMLNSFGNAPLPLSKKGYERLTRLRTSFNDDNAEGRTRHVLKDMMKSTQPTAGGDNPEA